MTAPRQPGAVGVDHDGHSSMAGANASRVRSPPRRIGHVRALAVRCTTSPLHSPPTFPVASWSDDDDDDDCRWGDQFGPIFEGLGIEDPADFSDVDEEMMHELGNGMAATGADHGMIDFVLGAMRPPQIPQGGE